jgi:hypothetical protein
MGSDSDDREAKELRYEGSGVRHYPLGTLIHPVEAGTVELQGPTMKRPRPILIIEALRMRARAIECALSRFERLTEVRLSAGDREAGSLQPGTQGNATRTQPARQLWDLSHIG